MSDDEKSGQELPEKASGGDDDERASSRSEGGAASESEGTGSRGSGADVAYGSVEGASDAAQTADGKAIEEFGAGAIARRSDTEWHFVDEDLALYGRF